MPFADVILSFITAFTLTYFAIPSIINIAKVKRLFDDPRPRDVHIVKTPSLGGIGIFAGTVFSISLWMPFNFFGNMQYILCAFILIFLIGAKDDLIEMQPMRKLAGEILAAAIIVLKAGLKITSFYGVFGIFDLPSYVSIPLSIFTIIVIINAFNLIDGINGLSGSIGTLISFTLGTWFYLVDDIAFAITAYSLAGATVAFLRYNFGRKAQIFMGDTGSLLLGLVSSILIIRFIEIHKVLIGNVYAMKAAPAVAIGILILPLYDTLRVFAMRAIKGKSPFEADRTHIHHLLLDIGFDHKQATGILIVVNVAFIALVLALRNVSSTFMLILLVLGLATVLTMSLFYAVHRKKNYGLR